MDSNLRSYPIRKTGKYTFNFETDQGDEYNCSFEASDDHFGKYPELSGKIFYFDLELESVFPKNKGIDKRIAATVSKIILHFLLSGTNAVIYICDPSEHRGEARARKFKSWYNEFKKYSGSILHYTHNAEAGGIRLFTALLIHRDNKLKERFIQAYLDFARSEE